MKQPKIIIVTVINYLIFRFDRRIYNFISLIRNYYGIRSTYDGIRYQWQSILSVARRCWDRDADCISAPLAPPLRLVIGMQESTTFRRLR